MSPNENVTVPLDRVFEPRFQGEGIIPGEYFLVSTKLETFCYPTVQTAACYVPWF